MPSPFQEPANEEPPAQAAKSGDPGVDRTASSGFGPDDALSVFDDGEEDDLDSQQAQPTDMPGEAAWNVESLEKRVARSHSAAKDGAKPPPVGPPTPRVGEPEPGREARLTFGVPMPNGDYRDITLTVTSTGEIFRGEGAEEVIAAADIPATDPYSTVVDELDEASRTLHMIAQISDPEQYLRNVAQRLSAVEPDDAGAAAARLPEAAEALLFAEKYHEGIWERSDDPVISVEQTNEYVQKIGAAVEKLARQADKGIGGPFEKLRLRATRVRAAKIREEIGEDIAALGETVEQPRVGDGDLPDTTAQGLQAPAEEDTALLDLLKEALDEELLSDETFSSQVEGIDAAQRAVEGQRIPPAEQWWMTQTDPTDPLLVLSQRTISHAVDAASSQLRHRQVVVPEQEIAIPPEKILLGFPLLKQEPFNLDNPYAVEIISIPIDCVEGMGQLAATRKALTYVEGELELLSQQPGFDALAFGVLPGVRRCVAELDEILHMEPGSERAHLAQDALSLLVDTRAKAYSVLADAGAFDPEMAVPLDLNQLSVGTPSTGTVIANSELYGLHYRNLLDSLTSLSERLNAPDTESAPYADIREETRDSLAQFDKALTLANVLPRDEERFSAVNDRIKELLQQSEQPNIGQFAEQRARYAMQLRLLADGARRLAPFSTTTDTSEPISRQVAAHLLPREMDAARPKHPRRQGGAGGERNVLQFPQSSLGFELGVRRRSA